MRRPSARRLAALAPALALALSGLSAVGGGVANAAVDVSTTPALVKITEFSYKYTTAVDHEFVELTNVGSGTLDLTGWVLTDNHHALTGSNSTSLSAITAIAPGESVVVSDEVAGDFRTEWGLPGTVQVVQEQNGLGYGNGDSVELYDNQGNLADHVDYPSSVAGASFYVPKAWLGTNAYSHWVQYTAQNVTDGDAISPAGYAAVIGTPGTTADDQYSFSPTGTGTSTCAPEAPSGTDTVTTPDATTWPGGSAVTAADGACSWLATNGPEGRDVSSLVFDNQTADGSVLYSVKNKSKLFRMTKTDGIWQSDTTTTVGVDDNWADGKEIRFGSGVTSNGSPVTQPDTEGLTQDPDGNLYVTTERANDANKYSLNSVLAYDPTTIDTTLTPTHMWDLRADFTSLFPASAEGGSGNKDDANLGFEGITFVPDTYLLANSFYDQAKAHRYNPTDYPNHGAGLFFLGLEKNGHIYAYALNSDNTFARVADLAGVTPTVQDLQFDPVKRGIWALCDNTCGVTSTFYAVNSSPTTGLTAKASYNRPAGLTDVNIEGFAVSPVATTTATREVVWSDDGIFPFGHALYEGTLNNTIDLNLVNLNDFHGRIDANTVGWAGYVETLAANAPDDHSLILSAGDNVSASLYASASQNDNPTLDVLNEIGTSASSLGNHEFDKGLSDLQDILNGTGVHAGHGVTFPYLGANVVLKSDHTQHPTGVEASHVFTIAGVKVAVIGAVTQETPSLVSPTGVSTLDFLTPWDGINTEVARLKADDPADVYIAVIHEGPIDGSKTLSDQLAASPVFNHIVNDIDPSVSALILGHTHQVHAWDAPNPGAPAGQATTRPVIQTGNYGNNLGNVVLSVDPTTKKVVSYTQQNVNLLNSTPAKTYTVPDSYFTGLYPSVADVKTTVDAALAAAATSGNVISGTIDADISRGYSNGTYVAGKYTSSAGDDRSTESALGTLIGNALRDKVTDYLQETDPTDEAEIGIVNPGGIRASLAYLKDGTNPNEDVDGKVSVAELNSILPFVNNLYTTEVTGTVLKKILEQQWQRNTDDQTQWSNPATIPSRPYLQLGLSDNMSYTFDASRPEGDRITSIWINGAQVTSTQTIKIATFSFLSAGGDNFRAFTQGTSHDTGLVDYQAWISYFNDHASAISPDFTRRSVKVTGLGSAYGTGQAVSFTLGSTDALGQLDTHSLGAPKSASATVTFVPDSGTDIDLGAATVPGDGTATVSFTAPLFTTATPGALVVTVLPTNTVVRIPITFGPGALDAPTFGASTSTAAGFTATITNPAAGVSYSVLSAPQGGAASISGTTVSLAGLQPGQAGSVVVQASKPGYTSVQAVVTGSALPAPAPVITAPPHVGGVKVTPPTSKKAGKAKVTFTPQLNGKKVTITIKKVKLTLKKGRTTITKTVTLKIKNGAVTVSLPKLAKGSWKATLAIPKNKAFKKTSKSFSVKVKK